jgi:hypothetical protein
VCDPEVVRSVQDLPISGQSALPVASFFAIIGDALPIQIILKVTPAETQCLLARGLQHGPQSWVIDIVFRIAVGDRVFRVCDYMLQALGELIRFRHHRKVLSTTNYRTVSGVESSRPLLSNCSAVASIGLLRTRALGLATGDNG